MSFGLRFCASVGLCLAAALCTAASAAGALPDCGPAPISVGYHQQGWGIDTELFNVMSKRTGCAFHFLEMPRARIWHDLAAQSLDMTSMGIETPERAEHSWFIPYVTTKYLAVWRPAITHARSAEDILGDDHIVIGVVRSFRHGEVIDALIDAIKARKPERVAELADEITLFKMLKANRVQVVFAEEYLFDYATKALAIADAAQTDIAPSEPPKLRCLVLSKTRFTREEMEKWRGLVEGLKQDGTLATILAEYLPPKDIPPMMGEK